MGSYQIWPCHVTQAGNLSFPYLKSYCPLDFRKSHQISWFCCIPNGSYKEDNLKEGRISPPPPPSCGVGLKWDMTAPGGELVDFYDGGDYVRPFSQTAKYVDQIFSKTPDTLTKFLDPKLHNYLLF